MILFMAVMEFVLAFPRYAVGFAFVTTGYALNYVVNVCIRAAAWCWDLAVEEDENE